MSLGGWAEILLAIGLSVAMGWPMGVYLSRVWVGESTWLDPVMAPLERLFYRAAGVDPHRGQGWFDYALALLTFNAAGYLLLYGVLRLQGVLPFNPQGFPGLRPDLAFNTAMSFVTNTDWQSYAGETTVSHFSQMAGLTVQNFVSAGSGVAVAAALARAFTANRARAIGNFWRDLVRIELYLFLPLAILTTIALVALGLPQTLAAHAGVHTLEGARQTLTLGPMASQQAINQLGANGGGFVNANAAHPFENPSGLSNLLETALMDAIGFACVVAFGRTLKAPSDTRALAVVMALFVTVAAGVIYAAETRPTPALAGVHTPGAANMEGKETRFGVPGSAAFAAMTTGSSTGSMNGAHESLTPAAGGMTLFMMQLGEMAPGGAGAGLYGMINMALLAVFVAGLLVGRTPEYLGKKIEAREIKLVLLAMILVSASSLGLTAIGLVLPVALRSLSASGPHGLTEMLYAYTSGAANNGSAFLGLRADTPFLNITLALAMASGRFGYILPVLALAGGLAAKPKLGLTGGTFPTDGPLFMGLLSAVILIMAGLQFFPAQALGPIVEQFQMMAMTRR